MKTPHPNWQNQLIENLDDSIKFHEAQPNHAHTIPVIIALMEVKNSFTLALKGCKITSAKKKE